MDLYKTLEKLNIKYEEIEHEAVFTVEEAKKIEDRLNGIGCKNLFLTDKKGRYYLVILNEDLRVNLKKLAKNLNTARLSFASEEELSDILDLKKGSVTPLGIINDCSHKVKIVIDKGIKDKQILCHPNTNTKTISIAFADLIKFVEYTDHEYVYM